MPKTMQYIVGGWQYQILPACFAPTAPPPGVAGIVTHVVTAFPPGELYRDQVTGWLSPAGDRIRCYTGGFPGGPMLAPASPCRSRRQAVRLVAGAHQAWITAQARGRRSQQAGVTTAFRRAS